MNFDDSIARKLNNLTIRQFIFNLRSLLHAVLKNLLSITIRKRQRVYFLINNLDDAFITKQMFKSVLVKINRNLVSFGIITS